MNKNENILWNELFNKKKFKYTIESEKINKITPYKLARIIYPELTKKKFSKIIFFLKKNLKIKKNKILLDFGSGNGAFLMDFQKKVKRIYSMEISRPLINFQKKKFKNIKYYLTNPYNIEFYKKINHNEIDLTICNSSFQYFYSNFYCELILKEMIRTTKETIFIYDIKDKSKKIEYLKNLRKRQKISKLQFSEKYKSTPLRFYDKEFFVKFMKKNYPKLNFKILKLPKEATDSKFGYCLRINKI